MSTAVLTPAVTSAGNASLSASTAAPQAAMGFLQKPLIPYLILGSFLIFTLPLCLLAASTESFLEPWSLGWLYVCALGTTHFVLTLTIYLQSSNLRYFTSSGTKRVLYFLVPILIFVFFDLYRALQVAVMLPALDLVVRCIIRILDFQHFNRQSYGVFQLFKGKSKAFPRWTRRVENYYFLGLSLLLFLSFLTGGRFDIDFLWTRLALIPVGICLLILLAGFGRAWRDTLDRTTLVAPFAYFLLQSTSAVLAIADNRFYLCCLAMHYVEYHVLMYPRCFHAPLDPRSRTDRIFAVLRRNKTIFYGLLLGLAGLVTYCTWLGMGSLIEREGDAENASFLVLISLFDGLFVFHYFIECLIWKFSDPHYRQTLGPLYFGQTPPKPQAALSSAPAH
jgi:hypothetical protein